MPEWLSNILGGFNFGSIGQLASSIFSSVANVKMQRETNATNMQIAREQNAAAAAESEKAYERSKATNQVRLMQDAGMSKAGALNAINGGGSYQPAPVNAGQAQAPQIDLTHAFDGMITAAENAKQRKLQEDLQEQQIKAAERAQKAQFEENAKQREHDVVMKDIDTANLTQHDYLEYEKHKESLDFSKQVYADAAPMREAELDILRQNYKNLQVDETTKRLNNDLLEIQKRLQNDVYDYKVLREKAESLTTAATGELERLRAGKIRNAILSMDSDELNAYMHYKARTELCVLLGDAIKDENWSRNLNENKLKILKMVDLLVGKGK